MMDTGLALSLVVLLPGLLFAVMAGQWLLGGSLSERVIARLSNWVYTFCGLLLVALFGTMQRQGLVSVRAGSGNWYEFHEFQIPLVLLVDRLSLPLTMMTVILCGLVGVFARRYLHREPGYSRFFILLHLFAFGALLVFTAGSFDLVIGGWEVICISSTLLVAFFNERSEPVKGAIRVYATYRGCDIGLVAGAFFLHHWSGSTFYPTLFPGDWPNQTFSLPGGGAGVIGLLMLLGAMGKSAQVPFSGWLPRAMEGPTPSSAIFYGAISVHAGAYLLLRAQPLLMASPVAAGAVMVVGALSAVHGMMVARVSSDVKTSLAYSSISQLGLIFVEIGAGFTWLPLIHIIGHAVVRTLQFLKAPSALHEYHLLHAAAGGQLRPTGAHFERLLPARWQMWLYRLALDRGHHDSVLDRWLVGALEGFGVGARRFEERF